jgi:hypothetical protein
MKRWHFFDIVARKLELRAHGGEARPVPDRGEQIP